MKMKNLKSVLLTFCISLILLFSCTKEGSEEIIENPNNAANPEYFFKVKMNSTSLSTITRSTCTYTRVGSQLILNAIIDNNTHVFKIKLFNYTTPRVYVIDASGQVQGLYQNQILSTSFVTDDTPQTGSFIEITSFDEVKKVVKGNFKFSAKLMGASEIRNFTEGSFSCSFL